MNYQDTIEKLPVEETTPNQEQLALAMSIFDYEKEMNCVLSEFKESVIIVILFIIFSLPQLDEMLKKYIPPLKNQVFLVGFKCTCVIFLYYMFKNYQVIKQK
jgi:hypothetical protein